MEAVHFVQFSKRLRRKKKTPGLGQFLKRPKALIEMSAGRNSCFSFCVFHFSFLIYFIITLYSRTGFYGCPNIN
jgi:hypothetical protein